MKRGNYYFLIVIVLIFVGGYTTLKFLGDAFDSECEKMESWRVKEYEIEKYGCLGWAGPRYYKFYLLKNGEILSESSQGIDSCMINFKFENERHFKFDICRNKIIE